MPFPRFAGFPAATAAVVLAIAPAPDGLAQSIADDFDDGNDAGWTRANPLEEFGVAATFTFPGGNSLRITTTPSPDPGALGASRAGLFREEIEFEAFRVSLDIVNWDPSLSQDAGILARVANLGLGTTEGYAWSLEFPDGLYLSLITGEAPTTLGQADFTPLAGRDYRLVFHGFGPELLGQCFDLADPGVPVAEVYAWDPSYESGGVGIFVNAARNTDGTDTTFDRFRADAEPDTDVDGLPDPWEQASFGNLLANAGGDPDGDRSPNGDEWIAGTSPTDPASRFAVHAVAQEDGDLVVTFPIVDDREFTLERSVDGMTWTRDEDAVLTRDGDIGRFVTEAAAGVPRGFARVRVRVVRP